MARLMPASAAMSSRLVAAKPALAKARVAAAMICSRRWPRGSRRTGTVDGTAASVILALLHGFSEFTTHHVHAGVYISGSTCALGRCRGRADHRGGRAGEDLPRRCAGVGRVDTAGTGGGDLRNGRTQTRPEDDAELGAGHVA